MMMLSKSEIINALLEAGYRMTRQRRTIVDILSKRSDHPSVRTVFTEANRILPEISLATVYNTLNALVKLGVLREIEFEQSENRFDTNLSPHINLVCMVCGNIEDYLLELPVKPQKIQKEVGFVTSDYRLEYRGICKICDNK